MFSRTITLSTNPIVQSVLYYHNLANATKPPKSNGGVWHYEDDFGQIFECLEKLICGDLITDIDKRLEAQEEMEWAKVRAEMKLEQRIEGTADVKAFFMRRRGAQQGQAQRIVMPQGVPQQ